MNEGDAFRSDGAYDPRSEARREPTIGGPQSPAEDKAFSRQSSRKIPDASDRHLLRGYEVNLADDEILVDEVEVVDTNGLNYLVLTDRRLIIRGRNHQTIYPLRAISRLAVLKYIRWWMVLLGVALSGFGALGALMPMLMFKSSYAGLLYLWAGLFVAGFVTAAVALLRPVVYVEIKCVGGDMKLRVTKDYEALVGFLSSLGQRIG